MSLTVACSVLLTSAAILLAFSLFREKLGRNPPGPTPWPLIGNLFSFPRYKPWLSFASWKEIYGDIIYMNMLGTPIIILNSLEACNDLLNKRSAKYSGRPRSIMSVELMGLDYTFSLMGYSTRWRRHRRLFHQHFNENACLNYRQIQEHAVHHFLQRLLFKPAEFLDHTRLLFGESILDIVYNIKVQDSDNIFIQAAEKAVNVFLETGLPVQFLVDVFPLLKHIPFWFPGGGFKRLAAEWKKTVLEPKDLPFAHAKKQMDEGTAGQSVLMSMLEKCNGGSAAEGIKFEEAPEDVAKGCAATAYIAGADTTLSSMQTFFMIMANHPEVQQTAQAEIDTLLGQTPSRLPSFEDKSDLPFTMAIIKELMRWHNVLPLGSAHVLTEDDEYKGYSIRSGTVVFPNVWQILHDQEIYDEPLKFNPRRWLIDTPQGPMLDPTKLDPGTAAFGFGRRICPGRHFVGNALFITVACVLACFDIKPLDTYNRSTERVEEAFTTGLLSYPVPYNVSLIPRSERLVQLITDLNQ